MTDLLDDIAGVFAEVIGPTMHSGQLVRSGWASDERGRTSRDPTGAPVLVQVDRLTWQQKQDGETTARDVRLIIMATGPDGAAVAPAPQDKDSVTVLGKTYRLGLVAQDPALSHWEARGTPTGKP